MASRGHGRRRRRRAPDLKAGRSGLPQLWGRHGFWQIRLRWAVAPLMIAGMAAGHLLGFRFPVVPIFVIALASPLYNGLLAILLGRYRERLDTEPRLDRIFTTAEVAADYAAIFLLIYFTGGASSPLAIFLIFHVVIAAIQFAAGTAYALAGVAGGGLWLMFLGELGGWLPGHPIVFRGVALGHADQPAQAVLTLFFLTATLFITANMIGRLAARLRQRVGDLAEATSDLARSHEAIQELMQERASFTLEVAHNLRAPLAAGLGIVDLLLGGYVGDLAQPQRDKLAQLDQRLRSLNDTIGKLLAIARTRDRSRQIEDVEIDLEKLARQTEETFCSEAKARGLELGVSLDDGLPKVPSGVGLLEQLMENLVSNAIKYTPAGGEVSVRFQHDLPGWVRLTVSDTGIGIPAAERDRLFHEFYRASNAREMTAEGTGLGLVLVQQTVDRHGGTLELASLEGEGTAVIVRLPVGPPAAGPTTSSG